MDRRKFLKGLAGLATIVVAGPSLEFLSPAAQADFVALTKRTKLIEGKTFYLEGPAILEGISYLKVRDCDFFAGPNFTGPMFDLRNCRFLIFEYNRMHFASIGGSGLYLRVRDHDVGSISESRFVVSV